MESLLKDAVLGWLPMQRNFRKRNLRQPIKLSQLPDSNLAYGSRDDLIGCHKLRLRKLRCMGSQPHGLIFFAGWPPFGHELIGHEPLTTLKQWKASRHRSLWLVVSN